MVEFLDSVTLQKLVDDQLAKGLVVENKPSIKRAISPMPISQPIRLTGPNSVFDLGNVFAKS
jgi:Rrf2 family iron-sulfur cluster assembly transcriptional regulator